LDEGRTTANEKLQKIIKGSLMEGEFERFVGAIGMILGQRQYNAQIFRDVLDFSTFMVDSGMWYICFSSFSTFLTDIRSFYILFPCKRGKGFYQRSTKSFLRPSISDNLFPRFIQQGLFEC
jgi:hypothetical protein